MHRGRSLRWSGALIVILSACRPPSATSPEPPPSQPKPGAEPIELEMPAGVRAGALEPTNSTLPLDIAPALSTNRSTLLESLDRSLSWFSKPSSQDAFPVAGVSHAWAETSVYAFKELLLSRLKLDDLERRIGEEFEFFASVGSDGRGTILFTGYYSPAFKGSRRRTDTYRYPLYKRPLDLLADERTGKTLGRQVGSRIEPYPTRAQLLDSGALSGLELVWMRSAFDAYVIQIQGSATAILPDGSSMKVAFDGSNGRPYTSIARLLVADGKIREDELSLPEVREYFETHPDVFRRYARRNERFIFFHADEGDEWPAGSLGVRVTPMRSLATDKDLFPPGVVVLVDTRAPDGGGGTRRLLQFMLDQDTGGAIKSPGRADIYYGVGPMAEELAGGQYAEGRLYYLLLKPERLARWRRRMVQP